MFCAFHFWESRRQCTCAMLKRFLCKSLTLLGQISRLPWLILKGVCAYNAPKGSGYIVLMSDSQEYLFSLVQSWANVIDISSTLSQLYSGFLSSRFCVSLNVFTLKRHVSSTPKKKWILVNKSGFWSQQVTFCRSDGTNFWMINRHSFRKQYHASS